MRTTPLTMCSHPLFKQLNGVPLGLPGSVLAELREEFKVVPPARATAILAETDRILAAMPPRRTPAAPPARTRDAETQSPLDQKLGKADRALQVLLAHVRARLAGQRVDEALKSLRRTLNGNS